MNRTAGSGALVAEVGFNLVISPGWFATFGTPLIAGRNLTDRDRKGAPPVVVVNQAFARKFLNGDGHWRQ
jgi:hypothetical protein